MMSGRKRVLRWGRWHRWICGALGVVAVAATARSFYVTDDFCACARRSVVHVQSGTGFLLLGFEGEVDKSRKEGAWYLCMPIRGGTFSAWWQETCWCWRAEHADGFLDYEALGFHLVMGEEGQRLSAQIQLPEWAIVGGLMAGVLRGLERRRSAEEGARRCVACGYDTRGNVERCSECGARIPMNAEF